MKHMCLFKKHKRIDWPYLVFGLVALGIIISTAILLLNIKTRINSGLKKGVDWTAQKIEQEKQVKADYLKALGDLKTQVINTKEIDGGLKLVEGVFFSVHVPQQFLDQHLKTWLAINRVGDLEVGVRKETILKMIDQLIGEVKK